MELVDEGPIAGHSPKAYIIQENNDGTTTVTTNKIDISSPSIVSLLHTLEKANIPVSASTVKSIQST
jgi:hypothetical protein